MFAVIEAIVESKGVGVISRGKKPSLGQIGGPRDKSKRSENWVVEGTRLTRNVTYWRWMTR
jgi:hypothetical protein